MSILGSRVVRREDPAFLTVGGTYVDDLRVERLEGAAHVSFVRSTVAHARILGIDAGQARRAPGVVAILTADDLDVGPQPPAPRFPPAMARPFLASDVVRFVGEPVAVIVTDERYQGPDAAELVVVDYDPLPVVIDPHRAAADDVVLHEGAGTNTVEVRHVGADPDTDHFARCDVVVTQDLVNQRLAAVPLEVRSAAAAWDGTRLTFWSSTQSPQSARDAIESAFGWDAGTVHLIAPDVGGGFGPKIGIHTDDMLVGWLARRLGRPLRWVETRTENLLAMGHGRAQRQTVTIGGSSDGRIGAYRLDVLADAGAYPAIGAGLPAFTAMMAAGVYAIPTVVCTTRAVVTNTMSTMAYRGAGRPEATAAIERAVDLFAAAIGMEPVDVRRRNLIPADAFPFTTAVGTTYDIGDYHRALDLVLEAADHRALREEQWRRRVAGDERQLGIGVSVYVEVTAGPDAGSERAKVEMRPDGTALVYTGTSPHGQGHATSWSMIAADQLGIGIDDVEVVHGDTDLVPVGVGTHGSRSLQLGGAAVQKAAIQLVDDARRVAADLLEANPDDVVLDREGGRFHVVGTPAVATGWPDVAASVAADGGLVAEVEFQASSPTYPFGAHVAVVEVDTATGKVTLERLIAVDDAGTVINPVVVEGQRHGGIAQGVAQALLEEVRYDDEGNPVTTNLADYAIVSASDLPSFELVDMATPTPVNPLGAKGVGESGTIGATPAVQNAVCDALAPFGVRHVDLPLTSERVWRAIIEAGRREIG